MTHVQHLKEIIAAWTSGDMEGVEAAVDRAVTHLNGEEPDSSGDGEPAPADRSIPPGTDYAPGQPSLASVGDMTGLASSLDVARRPTGGDLGDAAFVRLYNAARRFIDQGPSASAMAELEAAVKNAEPYVR